MLPLEEHEPFGGPEIAPTTVHDGQNGEVLTGEAQNVATEVTGRQRSIDAFELRPDRLTGERLRIEHWVVAQRQGQTAARNLLGARERFDAVPFFWTEQYDFALAYVGHAASWDEAEIDGTLDPDAVDCTITYRRERRKLAVAVVRRDLEGLLAEVEFERAMREGPS